MWLRGVRAGLVSWWLFLRDREAADGALVDDVDRTWFGRFGDVSRDTCGEGLWEMPANCRRGSWTSMSDVDEVR
jgi:putative component of toxin-antitoxin plasmid stabilization module